LQTVTRLVFPILPVVLDGLLVNADGLEHAFVGCTGRVQKCGLGIVENAEPRRRLDHRQGHVRKVHRHRNLSITVARLAMDDEHGSSDGTQQALGRRADDRVQSPRLRCCQHHQVGIRFTGDLGDDIERAPGSDVDVDVDHCRLRPQTLIDLRQHMHVRAIDLRTHLRLRLPRIDRVHERQPRAGLPRQTHCATRREIRPRSKVGSAHYSSERRHLANLLDH
jgi:hypothetical protein